MFAKKGEKMANKLGLMGAGLGMILSAGCGLSAYSTDKPGCEVGGAFGAEMPVGASAPEDNEDTAIAFLDHFFGDYLDIEDFGVTYDNEVIDSSGWTEVSNYVVFGHENEVTRRLTGYRDVFEHFPRTADGDMVDAVAVLCGNDMDAKGTYATLLVVGTNSENLDEFVEEISENTNHLSGPGIYWDRSARSLVSFDPYSG